LEFIMKVKQLFALGTLAVAAGAALAQTSDAPLTRAEVRQSVLDARAAGTLVPRGQADDSEFPQVGPKSTLTRASVNADVKQAIADGEMRYAGQAGGEELATYQREVRAPSQEARADVKAEVLQARADGTLKPAGQAEYPSEDQAFTRVARAAKAPSTQLASRAH
jgi:hypothetical protein